VANTMVENVIGTFGLPNAVAVNFVIDGRERVVPMVIEEPSVLAAVSHMARVVRDAGGFITQTDPSIMIGQIQLTPEGDHKACIAKLEEHLDALLAAAKDIHPRLRERGGGVRSLEVRELVYDESGHPNEHMVVLQFYIDCVDAMGANMVNTVAERLSPMVEELTGERVRMAILSNLADRRLARAKVSLPLSVWGKDLEESQATCISIAAAWRFAWADPYRATTHNKGVMNGIDAVVLATGNDWRAIEAGAHAFAARTGSYRPLTRWEVVGDRLEGSIEIPLQLGTVGGTIPIHPTVRANLDLMGVTSSRELSAITAAVGLAQNLGALKALVSEGIQAGHMRMHARTVAAVAGATEQEIPLVMADMVSEQDISAHRAEVVLRRLRAVQERP
jgi:hydroxymethylglutaryl-CoA reductase